MLTPTLFGRGEIDQLLTNEGKKNIQAGKQAKKSRRDLKGQHSGQSKQGT